MLDKEQLTRDELETYASHRALRIVTIIDFFFAVPLLIAHAALSHGRDVFPLVGLVPLFISASSSWIQIATRVQSGTRDSFMDAFMALLLLGIMIPSWIELGHYYWNVARALVAAFATMPMIMSFCIHVYLSMNKPIDSIAKRLGERVEGLFTWECPHCGNHPRVNWRRGARQGSLNSPDVEERYRDEPEAGPSESAGKGSVFGFPKSAKQQAAPLFQTPPPEQDEEGYAVLPRS